MIDSRIHNQVIGNPGVMSGNRRMFDGAAADYISVVLGVQSGNLLAFWPLNETSGTNADNAEGTAARDGTYDGVTLNQIAGPFGEEQAGLWDGVNDLTNIYSASFASVFDTDEGSVSIWQKVTAGAWTDGSGSFAVVLKEDNNNRVRIVKGGTNNTGIAGYEAIGNDKEITKTSFSPAGWFHVVVTWSVLADEVKVYFDGAQEGATLTGLSTWAIGTLNSNGVAIGAGGTNKSNPYDGYLMYCAVWDTPLSSGDITTLYNGGPV